MCTFIYVLLQEPVDEERLESILAAYHQPLRRVHESPLPVAFSHENHIFMTNRYCDCDTGLGEKLRDHNLPGKNFDRVRKKFQRKGWSEGRIAQVISEMQGSQVRHEELRQERFREKGFLDVQRWLQLIREMLSSGAVSSVDLVKHFFSDEVRTSDIPLQRTERVPWMELNSERLLSLEDDILYQFMPPS